MIEAVRSYLALLRLPPEAGTDRLQALAKAFDLLAYAYHHVPEAIADDGAEPPERINYSLMREAALQAFPDLGMYAVVAPETDSRSEPMMGDAIDDLADIGLELAWVEWRWAHNSQQDAAWHFRFSYRSHWGIHLHNLRRYLHARQFDSTRS
ncbi:MAG: DUF5063 domain-containing protein [Dongiaceae bacterium]